MVALIFPGQGSQKVGMGDELFDRFPDHVAEADRELGFSIVDLCRTDPDGSLRSTRWAQPALFVVSALQFLARPADAPRPTHLAGHSLGEYAALFAAGSLDFATGLRLVRRRGELMGAADGGAMAAVIGADVARVEQLLSGPGSGDLAGVGRIEVANDNAPDQVVLAGPPDALDAAIAVLTAADGLRCMRLKVSAAFHSSAMADASERFAEVLADASISDPSVPVLSNVTAEPYRPGEVRALLARQIRERVRWREISARLLADGVADVEEIGPGTVLTGLWRKAVETRPARAERVAAAPAPTASTAPAPPAPDPSSLAGPAVVAPAGPPARPEPAPLSGSGLAQAAGSAVRTAADPGAALRPEDLGSAGFRRDYGLRYAYLAGAMFRGIASADLVIRLARHGLMGYFGAGGLRPDRVEAELLRIKEGAGDGSWGMNLLHDLHDPTREDAVVALYLRHDVRFVEAAGFSRLTPAVVRFRYSGSGLDSGGRPQAPRRVLAKVSRPEMAEAFLRPAPPAIVDKLEAAGDLTATEARVARMLPISEELCAEADSGGHTDGAAALTLLPAMLRLRDREAAQAGHGRALRVGAAGGVGSPEAVAALFMMGADFVLTGSVNQCSPQAGTSDEVKELLAGLDIQDTGYAPAGDMFEVGARVQVVRKGTMFAARANKLHEIYRRYDDWADVDERTRTSIERGWFRRSFDEVWAETRRYHLDRGNPDEVERAEQSPKHRMALTFRWYFVHSVSWALTGDPDGRVDYQVQCGHAMGAFNHAVRDTALADWRSRNVESIAEHLLTGAAELLSRPVASTT